MYGTFAAYNSYLRFKITSKHYDTLNAICSMKWATPLFSSFSKRLPESIHSPTVAVAAPLSSLATRMPLSRVVTLVGGWLIRVSLRDAAVDRHCTRVCVKIREDTLM